MNKLNACIPLGAALLLAPFTSTIAQPAWETVDALAPYAGRAIVADSSGNFISLSISTNSTTPPVSTVVSLSSDHGLTWHTVGSFGGYALKLATTPDGTLYASGNRSATVSGKAFVWFSRDHGVTWPISDPWAGQTTTLYAMDLAGGNSGAIYVCGYYPGPQWVVRKGVTNATGGLTWTTVENYSYGEPLSISVRPGPAGQPDTILVCGGAIVRRSTNGGATWATVDTYGSYIAMAVTAGTDGSAYAIGRTAFDSSKGGWVVRKSADAGTTWATVDSVANSIPAFGSGLMIDAFGRVFAVGYLNQTPNTWLVRGSADGGVTWTTTDTFLPAGYTSSQAMGAASDASGNVCVIGAIDDGTALSEVAPIRRLATP